MLIGSAVVAVRAEDQIDAGDGASERVVVLQMLVPDHDHGVDVLFVAQRAHDVARRLDGISKDEAVRFHERFEIGAGHGKDADAEAVALDHVIALKAGRVGAEDRIAHALAASRERLRAVVGIVIAEGHVVDDAIEPRPFRAAVFVRPRRRAFVDHVAAAEDDRAAFFFGGEIAGRPGDAAAVRAFLGIERNSVRMVVGELQEDNDDCSEHVGWRTGTLACPPIPATSRGGPSSL
jgi:hypothetical protein